MQIVMIPTNKIYGHPQNPRTDNGDLTELTSSIRTMGVLQNLTVVPYDPAIHQGANVPDDGGDYYIAVIGNRRLAAAKKAKLTEVPCAVASMDAKEQMKTMLVENLQRETLTPFQQAKTIQLMLDLGDTVETIAKETGFSEGTVRNRMKLSAFDQAKLAEVESRGASLKDYMDLAKLEDEGLRNEVLGTIGTAEFRNALLRAQSTLRDRKNKAEQIAWLTSFAKEVSDSDTSGLKYVRSIYSSDSVKNLTLPDDKDTVQYYYSADCWYLRLYREKTAQDTADDLAAQQRNDTLKMQKETIMQATDRARTLRLDFVKNLSFTKMKQNYEAVIKAVASQLFMLSACSYSYIRLDHALLHELISVSLDDNNRVCLAELKDEADRRPEWTMFALVYSFLDTGKENYYSEQFISGYPFAVPKYNKNATMDTIYDLLVALGYEMSTEEKQLSDGSHPGYYVEPKKESKKKTA